MNGGAIESMVSALQVPTVLVLIHFYQIIVYHRSYITARISPLVLPLVKRTVRTVARKTLLVYRRLYIIARNCWLYRLHVDSFIAVYRVLTR